MNIAEAHTGTVRVPGGALTYDVLGHGFPLVLLHAGIADRRMWNRELLSFPRTHRVIRYDVRGFGESPPATAPYSCSEDLRCLLDELGCPSTDILAASQGGAVALDFALRYPGRVRRVVTVGSGFGLFPPPPDPALQRSFRELEQLFTVAEKDLRAGQTEAVVAHLLSAFAPRVRDLERTRLVEMLRKNFEEVVTDRSHRFATYHLTPDQLPALTLPVLVLSGSEDLPALRWSSRKLSETLGHAEFREIPGADHLPNLSAPAALDEAVQAFLVRGGLSPQGTTPR